LDTTLNQFLYEREGERAKKGRAVKVEGVWVGCRGGATEELGSETVRCEEDEMIWWSWDGKLVGFSDW